MLAFLLQIKAWTESGTFFLFAVFMLVIWLLWAIRMVLASFYKPWHEPFEITTSVIIPVVDEPEELFREVLRRITEQKPTEVIVVINGPHNDRLEKACVDFGVRWAWSRTPGKRNAVQIGVGLARGDIAVLVDSDTVWTPSTLAELVKPFRDPRVGGVTTRQRILDPQRSVLTRWADWLESVRNEYSMPAMSVLGTVGCLPGRTIAFRRSILVEYMERFLTERFLGVFLEVSDDRTLTNYTLMAGYRTVFQATSLVHTDAPTALRKLVRQQYRWARGSQYNTLRMLPWMLRHAPALAMFYIADIVVPFVLVGSFASWGIAVTTGARAQIYQELPLPGTPWAAALVVLGLTSAATVLSLAIRFGRHFAYRPKDLRYLPIFMLINTFVLMPVRVAGFFRMAHNAGWGTRANGFAGEEEPAASVVDGTGSATSRKARRRLRANPLAIVPYLLGGSMLVAAVLLGV
jgi:hyaluronan synthase